jgi:hypothetical protein
MLKETTRLPSADVAGEYELHLLGSAQGWPEMAWCQADGTRLLESLTPVVLEDRDVDGLMRLAAAEPCFLGLGLLDHHPHHALVWNTPALRKLNEQAEVEGIWSIERYLGHYLMIGGQYHCDPEILLLVRLRDPRFVGAL